MTLSVQIRGFLRENTNAQSMLLVWQTLSTSGDPSLHVHWKVPPTLTHSANGSAHGGEASEHSVCRPGVHKTRFFLL